MTERSIMGIPVNPCVNGITKTQIAKINEIDGMKADIIELQSEIGNSGKEWIKLPYENYSEFQPYIEKILDYDESGDFATLKYDLLIIHKKIEDEEYLICNSFVLPKNTRLNNETYFKINNTVYGEYFNETGYFTYSSWLEILSIIESSASSFNRYTYYIGVVDGGRAITTDSIVTGADDITDNRSNLEFYVFATDLESL